MLTKNRDEPLEVRTQDLEKCKKTQTNQQSRWSSNYTVEHSEAGDLGLLIGLMERDQFDLKYEVAILLKSPRVTVMHPCCVHCKW